MVLQHGEKKKNKQTNTQSHTVPTKKFQILQLIQTPNLSFGKVGSSEARLRGADCH